jgi:VanZ family protein
VIAPRWRPPLAWAAIILVLTSVPIPATPVDGIGGIDKVVHLAMYAVLGALAARSAWLPAHGRRATLLVLVGVLVFAALDEWHQSFVPGRSADPLDWVADAIGAIAGTAFALRALHRSERYT